MSSAITHGYLSIFVRLGLIKTLEDPQTALFVGSAYASKGSSRSIFHWASLSLNKSLCVERIQWTLAFPIESLLKDNKIEQLWLQYSLQNIPTVTRTNISAMRIRFERVYSQGSSCNSGFDHRNKNGIVAEIDDYSKLQSHC